MPFSTCHHGYPFRPLSLVGSYQVGYTRSHPNTEVKMLRACSVPLCSHRWERQVIYLFVFLLIYKDKDNTIQYIWRQYNIIYMKTKRRHYYTQYIERDMRRLNTIPSMFMTRDFISVILSRYIWEVSWCSWLSHHFYVVRVPGSNPGGTIFTYQTTLSAPFTSPPSASTTLFTLYHW